MCVPYLCWESQVDEERLSTVLLHHLMKLTDHQISINGCMISQIKPLNSRLYCLGKYSWVYYDKKLQGIIKCYKQRTGWTKEMILDAIEGRTIACEREKRWALGDAYEWIAFFTTLIKHFDKVLFFYSDFGYERLKIDQIVRKKRQIVTIKELCPDTLLYLKEERILEIRSESFPSWNSLQEHGRH